MVYIKENFLTDNEVDILIKAFGPQLKSIAHVVPFTETALGFQDSKAASQWTFDKPITAFTDNQDYNNNINLLTSVYKRIKAELEQSYQKELGLVQFILNRMYPGAKNHVHIDNATGMYPELEYSAMVYLNDCGKDFQGGQLNFPNQNMELQTKKGMLVFFKGDEETPHGVNQVTQGHRDNFISFFKSL